MIPTDAPKSLEARLRYAREELLPRYSECTCPTDTSPLCDHCVVRDLLNEIGHILADLETNFLGREGKHMKVEDDVLLSSNHAEKVFHDLWQEENDQNNTLEYLLGADNRRGEVSGRDALVAATVIQWLGSPYGANFLRRTALRVIVEMWDEESCLRRENR